MRSSFKGHRPPARLKVVVLIGAVAATTLSGQSVASAAIVMGVPATTPTITLPSDGDTVSTANMSVSATSSAEVVRFVLDGRGGVFTEYANVVAGTASTDLPVFGVDGATQLQAFDCDALNSCNATAASIGLVIDLPAPVLTAPSNNKVVGNSFVATAEADQGAIAFRVNSVTRATDLAAPYSKTLSIKALPQGNHTVRAVQCDASGNVCEGPASNVRTIIKDTRGPQWSDVNASPGTVFPFRDHYQDTTKLSVRVGERARSVRLEIRKKGGPIVRTFKLGTQEKGRVTVGWNGRKANGDLVHPGGYLFHFEGSDTHGVASKSNDHRVNVSDKRLVRKSDTKNVSAKSSFAGNGSGACSGVYKLNYPQARFDWPNGAGYYSRSRCNGSRADDLALAVHKVSVPDAVRYGSVSISTYGAGAFRHAGPAVILYLKSNDSIGQAAKLSTSVGWHGGGRANLEKYVQRGGMRWAVATNNGNWYDVKEFRVSYSYSVLRSP